MSGSNSENFKDALALVFIASVFLFPLCLLSPVFPADDALIHFRVVRNFASLGAPFFNSGEAVAVSSSLLWTLLLTSLHIVLPEISLFALVSCLQLLIGLALPLLAFIFLRGVGVRRAWALFGAVAILGSTLGALYSLMESPLALLLVLGAWILLGKERVGLCFILLALALMVRLEMIVVVILTAGFWLQRTRKGWIQIVLPICSVLGAYVAYQLLFFDSILPSAMQAKAAVYQLGYMESAGRLLHSILLGTALGRELLVPTVLASLIACLFGVARFKRMDDTPRSSENSAIAWWSLLALLSGAVIALTYIMKRVLIFPWYTVNFFPLFLLGLVLLRSRYRGITMLSLVCAAPGVVFVLQAYGAAFLSAGLYAGNPYDARVVELRAVSTFLEQTPSIETVMAPEIGAVGYEFRRELIDSVGIASPSALRFHRSMREKGSSSVGQVPLEFIRQETPDAVLGYEIFFEKEILSGAIAPDYALFRLPAFSRPATSAGISSNEFEFGPIILLTRKEHGIKQRELERFRELTVNSYYAALRS